MEALGVVLDGEVDVVLAGGAETGEEAAAGVVVAVFAAVRLTAARAAARRAGGVDAAFGIFEVTADGNARYADADDPVVLRGAGRRSVLVDFISPTG